MARIRKRDLINVFFRSFYIQAAWNYERMLGLGFCYCLIPIAKRLFKDDQKQVEFLKRHIGFFNSHPYMSGYALGAVANIEQQALLKNWEDSKPVDVFKKRIIGPLGAIGDTLFWQLLLPGLAILGVISLYLFNQWGALAFLFIYNFIHIFIRFRGLIKSYWKGFDIIRDLSLRGTKRYFQILKSIISFLLGFVILFVFFRIFHVEHEIKGTIVFFVSIIFSFFMMRKRRLTIDLMVVIVILGSIIMGLLF